MVITELSRKLRGALRKFGRAERGNVVLIFSLALVPIMGMVGAAADYSRANSDKAAMQAAIDATALMLSQTAASQTGTQLSQNATSYFNAVFTAKDVTNVVLTPTFTSSGGNQVQITASADVPPSFSRS